VSGYVVHKGRHIEVETIQPKALVKPKRSRQGQFVQMPLGWVERLQAARCIGSYRLALHFLFEHWKSGSKSVKIPNVVLGKLGIRDREAKWRALRELERLELIDVEHHPRKSPVVTIRG